MRLLDFRLLAVFVLVGQSGWNPSSARPGEWERYENPRYGYSILYPTDIFRPGAESEGGSLVFKSRDGRSKLTVFASYNEENISIAAYRSTILNKFSGYDHMDYSPVRGSWFVLSGEREGNVYYQKVLFSCGGRVINAFALTYPVAEKRAFDPIVTMIEKNFRSSNGRGCSPGRG